jgi:hypothetical protein
MVERLAEGLFGAVQLRAGPAGVPHVSPGAGAQVLDQLRAIPRGIETLAEAKGEKAQLLRMMRITGRRLPTPLDQQLEQPPGVESRTGGEDLLPSPGRMAHQLHEEVRGLVPLRLHDPGPTLDPSLGALEGRGVAAEDLLLSGRLLRPRQVVDP